MVSLLCTRVVWPISPIINLSGGAPPNFVNALDKPLEQLVYLVCWDLVAPCRWCRYHLGRRKGWRSLCHGMSYGYSWWHLLSPFQKSNWFTMSISMKVMIKVIRPAPRVAIWAIVLLISKSYVLALMKYLLYQSLVQQILEDQGLQDPCHQLLFLLMALINYWTCMGGG